MFRSWRELPPGERLKLAYIPLFIGLAVAVGAIVVARLASSFESHGSKLQLVSATVADRWTETGDKTPHVEVKLHNTGDRRAILTWLDTKVHRSAVLPACLVFGGEGTYETGRYSIKLPQRPRPGFERKTVLNEEAGADAVDRFRAKFETATAAIYSVMLYEISLTVAASDGERVHLGQFLLMTPWALDHWSWDGWLADESERRELRRRGASPSYDVEHHTVVKPSACYTRNLKAITPFLDSRAKRSAAVDAVLAHAQGLTN